MPSAGVNMVETTLAFTFVFGTTVKRNRCITVGSTNFIMIKATTNIYAEVDLEMKAKALANCEVKEDEPKKPWREDKGLMDFLRTL